MKAYPDHHETTVGKYFRAYCSYANRQRVFYCDSYDPVYGFWMTSTDAPLDHQQDEDGEYRKNVSVRSIGRGFIRVERRDDGAAICEGLVVPENEMHLPKDLARIKREEAIIAKAEAEIDAGLGIVWDDDLEAWFDALEHNPDAPIPQLKKI